MADQKVVAASDNKGAKGAGGGTSNGGPSPTNTKVAEMKREGKDETQNKSPKKRRKVNHGMSDPSPSSLPMARGMPLLRSRGEAQLG